MEHTINSRQFSIIIFVVAVSSKIFMLPALIIGISGRDSWLTILIYFAVEFAVLLLILFAIKKTPNMSVYALLQSLVGSILTKVILLFIILFYLFKITVMISEIKVFFVITATESLNWQLCVIPLLIAFAMMSLKTLRGLVRLSEITLPFIIISFAILGLIMAKNADFTNILPLFENGIERNIDSFRLLPIWLTDFSVLTIFLGRIKEQNKLKLLTLLSASISFIIVLYFNFVMITTYSYTPNLLDYGHNVTNMLLYPTGTYNYGRVDLVIFSIWMIGIMIHVALLFYTTCRHLGKVGGIRNNYITATIVAIALFVLLEFIFPDELKLYSYSVSIFNYCAFVIEICFPVLIFFCSIFSKKKKDSRKNLLQKNKIH